MSLCTSALFSQTYEYNRQYLLDPRSAICDDKNMIDFEQTISLKTNIMNFANSYGQYHVNFIFKRDFLNHNQTVELFIKIHSPYLITSFDGLDQNIKILVTDGGQTCQWVEFFSFNKREAHFEMLKNHTMRLTLRKKLSYEDFMLIQTIFSHKRGLTVILLGIQGQYGFAIPPEIAKVYQTLFDYKQLVYNN